MNRTGGRLIAVAIVGLLVAACSPGDDPAPTGATEPTSQSTTSAAPVANTTTTEALSDLIQLPVASPVAGEAPVVLDYSGDLPVNYLRYLAWVDDLEAKPPPEGLTVDLRGCSLIGPGVVVYDLTLDGDVTYPLDVTVDALVIAGDMGTGTYGTVTFGQAGRQLLVSSLPDQVVAYEETLDLSFRNDRYGNQVGRRLVFSREGTTCQLGLDGLRTEHADLVGDPAPLVATAPAGTVEHLAQAAWPAINGADLLPIVIAYGEALRFYSDVWFIPEQSGHLDRMEERLSDDGCLEFEFIYDEYTVLQSLNCPFVDGSAVREVGSQWFATATDGRWIVTVAGDDESLVTETAESLQPHWHLFHREVPLEPVDETVMGRTEFDGAEYLVTFGEQRCEGTCRSPETWFYIYRVSETGLEEYAHYPGYGQCLLAEEDDFVLAVAPDRGSIDVESPGFSGMVTDAHANPFLFESTTDGPFTIRVLDEDGVEARCVELLATDARGGIGPFPGSDEPAPPPEADRTIFAEACSSAPWYIEQWTDEEPLRQACVDTGQSHIAASLVVPRPMLGDEATGEVPEECLLVQVVSSAAASCSSPDRPITGVLAGWDDFMSYSTVVPVGTEHIMASTSRGTELVGIPYDGLATVWWLSEEGDLVEVSAVTGDGNVVLYPEP